MMITKEKASQDDLKAPELTLNGSLKSISFVSFSPKGIMGMLPFDLKKQTNK